MIDEIRSSSNLSRSLIVCRPLLGFSKRCRVSPFKTRRNALFDLIGRRTCLSSFDEAGKKTGSLCDLFPPLGQLTHGKTPDDKTRPVSHVENETTTTATKKKDSPEKGSWGSAYTFWALSLLPSECCCCYALGVWNEWNGYEPNACQLLCSIATGACERPSHFISLFVFALRLCLFVYLFLFSKYLYIYIYK